MSDVIITAIIAATASTAVQLISANAKKREMDAKLAARDQRQIDTLENLTRKMESVEKRLDQHNGYAEKFARASTDIALIKKDIEYLKGSGKC